MQTSPQIILVGARASPLSQVQLKEVENELKQYHPEIEFQVTLLSTQGDKDLTTSLRDLGKTDFFTKEIDAWVLKEGCRIAIHSAKDLPDPLPKGLTLAALTKGLDPSDSLVMPAGCTIETLRSGAVIATSSIRREEAVKVLRRDLDFVDIRGTIHQRLAKLDNGEVEGVVIAEAALLRLGLTDRNRIRLPGLTTPHQGQLAIVCKTDDREMIELFSCLDTRKTVLYLGLEAPLTSLEKHFIHYPVIHIVPTPCNEPFLVQALREFPAYTHLIFTSKSAVKILLHYVDKSLLDSKHILAVGKLTAACLEASQLRVERIAKEEHAEGIVEELRTMDLKDAYFFWPHSALSRRVLPAYFDAWGIRYKEVVIYETHPQKPLPVPNLDDVDELYFTSPSTVDAFVEIFGKIPEGKELNCIGPVTKARLDVVSVSA